MSRRRCLAAALLILTSGCATVTTREPWPDLPRGQYKVGFRTAGQVSIWYPASSGGEPLRFRDYARTFDELETSLHTRHFSDQAIVDLFDTRMFARRDAAAIDKKFPVVMIVAKDAESAPDHAMLAEFLAGHGYVVAVATAKAPVDSIRPTIFLHEVDVNTWAFLSNPADAKQKAEKMLAFLTNR
ncbi:MAG TPA: hypothetical protein VF505_06490 [Thermoanaerobaculia bacterium]